MPSFQTPTSFPTLMSSDILALAPAFLQNTTFVGESRSSYVYSLPVLVSITIALRKHHEQKQRGEERIYLAHWSHSIT